MKTDWFEAAAAVILLGLVAAYVKDANGLSVFDAIMQVVNSAWTPKGVEP